MGLHDQVFKCATGAPALKRDGFSGFFNDTNTCEGGMSAETPLKSRLNLHINAGFETGMHNDGGVA